MSTSGLSGLSSFHGSWASTFSGHDRNAFKQAISWPVRRPKPLRFCPMMKNIKEGKGFFAPIVVLGRNVIENKRFNQSQGVKPLLFIPRHMIQISAELVINEFCKTIGADGKQRQGLIWLAKKNDEKLGFLA